MSLFTSFPASAQHQKPARKIDFGVTTRKLWPYLWPADRPDLKKRIYLSLMLLLAAKIVTVTIPYSFKWAVDALALPQDNGQGTAASLALHPVFAGPIVLTLLYGLLRIVMALLTQVRDGVFADVAMHAVRRLARDVFVHLHSLSLRFHLERKTGGLTRILERGRNSIETIVRTTVLTAIPTAVEFVLILGILLHQFDWRYALIVITMIIAYTSYTTACTNWRIGIRKAMNESDTDANTKAIDSLLNFETVKYFNAEAREKRRYDDSISRYEQMSIKTYTSLAWLNAGQAVIFTLGLTLVMVLCIRGIHEGTNTPGDFVLINAMMIQLYQPLSYMGLVYREIRQSTLDIETMFEILGKSPEVADRPGAKPLIVREGGLRLDHVSFHYDERRPILKDVSFEVPPGKTVAIVGPSGAGKSTLSRLIFRFYEPSSGHITIDGQDIGAVTQVSLRGALGIVPQDTVLFNDTLDYNIRYGRPDATDAEVREAAHLAQIDGFIESAPGGYQAAVGERGLKLSGGEKQRVAIARTILKAPPILVLDEATSALDSFTERAIQGALDQVARGRTTLVIAHRLSTIVGADEILVLDKGEIVERGTHAELVAQQGIYASMWSRQHDVELAEEILRRAAAEEGQAVEISLGERGKRQEKDEATTALKLGKGDFEETEEHAGLTGL
ncbi:ABCB family ABC transporter ATP-binding protein/permease [Beijerinckia indica]|uniref:ABC transporter related n=1 Tax=Beijerinckia indica subsp. indica (strain ATCC 9039 / DSM 1715 / NCIMB 8712) TaxID=395963 RepID=B2IED5_BEII9|nr:ABC transporter ATP-binding protein/permease [Beijerinckia indica]ACB95533.1 ABC transporter related [Beijerinckia indica subsp. indica ATCC 9039]